VPIYDYACGACGRVTEVIHGIHDGGPRFCPACGAEGSMRKTLSTPAIVFKGSGWAKVDRRSSDGAGSRSAGSRAKTAEAPAGEGGDGASAATAPGGHATSSDHQVPASSSTGEVPRPTAGRAASERGPSGRGTD
jgi:putative FmdB family regulatory protein